MRLLLPLLLASFGACSQTVSDIPVGDGCEDCDLIFKGMPATIPASISLAPANEPGEWILIRGVIFQPDGKTPAPGVILYVYQTDATGKYQPSPSQVHARRHGHLRGWIKTDAQGRYEFHTIRPASYPRSNIPQHIHAIIREPGKSVYWIDDFLFDDDPFLNTAERSRQEQRGGNGIITLTRNEPLPTGTRNIILGYHIPNYQ